MIRNFEEYTSELSEEEIKYIVPRLLKILILTIGKDKALTNKQIVKDINIVNQIHVPIETKGSLIILEHQVKTSEARIRHMIHVLRVSDMISCLIATSKGYYISNDKQEIETYIGSVDDRLRSIYQIRRALKRQLKEWGRKPEGIQREISFANGELNY